MIHIKNECMKIIIIGVGGTGGNFAKELCRLVSSLPENKVKIVFVDGDIVEKKNKSRQPFGSDDINQNKAVILAEKCSDFFGLDVIANPNYISDETQLLSLIQSDRYHLPIVCGCVDNHRARQIMHEVFNQLDNIIYIDSANEDWYGEVVCGIKANGIEVAPPRAHYFPEVLTDTSLGKEEESCETINLKSPQHLVTNLTAANIILSYLSDILIKKQISGGITYFDVTKKFMRTIEYAYEKKKEDSTE